MLHTKGAVAVVTVRTETDLDLVPEDRFDVIVVLGNRCRGPNFFEVAVEGADGAGSGAATGAR
ncbi:Uncharacterised protein [Mycolicibacterium fortuitum]|uniref:Uncharacterized protein n=1 Tax=Mycolicibacterium fortuitum TaxID=1766 RepID=A0A378UA41_MYCFO|nr:Uncharacterised protein [Mycolicibacterium fortuitum]